MINNKYKVLLLLVLVTCFLFFATSALADTMDYKIFDTKQNVSINKSWLIKFNQPIVPESLVYGTILVTRNSDGQVTNNPAPVVQADGKSLLLNPPVNGYEPNTAYTLKIKEVQAHSGKTLARPVKMGFVTATSEVADKPSIFTVSPQEPAVTTDYGVTVDLGEYVLEAETNLVVSPQAIIEDPNEGLKIIPYDITLEGITELGDYITIRIPYDDTYCLPGQNASDCVGAKRYLEDTGIWQEVLYDVDTINKELVIYTDRLSIYAAFHVKNKATRAAHFTNINESFLQVDLNEAVDVLNEYLENGGQEGDKAAGLGAAIVAKSLDLGDTVSTGIDIIDNPLNIAGLGNPVFDSKLFEKAYDGMGKLGTALSVIKIGEVVLKSDASDSDILNLYKDVAFLALGSAKSAALGLAMSGVWIFDCTINHMFAENQKKRMEDMARVYQYYNDEFNYKEHKARTLRDWRQILIDIVEANPGDEQAVKAAIEAEVDHYASLFWDWDRITNIQTDLLADLDMRDMPKVTESEIKKITADYKSNLYDRLHPVSLAVTKYMEQKVRDEYVNCLENVREFYNQRIKVAISEKDIISGAQGDSSKYAGYTMRFEPLSQDGMKVKQNWTGKIRADGTAATEFTMLGFIQAGSPDKLALYAPAKDPDIDVPDLEVPFTLKAPLTEIDLPVEDDFYIILEPETVEIASGDLQIFRLVFKCNRPDNDLCTKFVWDFGDGETGDEHNLSKGEETMGTMSYKEERNNSISHKYNQPGEYILNVEIQSFRGDETYAKAQAHITVPEPPEYQVTILGDKEIYYELVAGRDTGVTHDFEAVIAPAGEYLFVYEFDDPYLGDDTEYDFINGSCSAVSYTYKYMQTYNPKVRVYKGRNTIGPVLAENDSITITLGVAEGDAGYGLPASNYYTLPKEQERYDIYTDTKIRETYGTELYFDPELNDTVWKMYGFFEQYVNDKLNCTGYYADGGKRFGLWEFWNDAGVKTHEYTYLMGGLLDGTAKEWYDNGEKKSETDYVAGEKTGMYYEWQSDKLYLKGSYDNDEKVGRWEIYNSNGRVAQADDYYQRTTTYYGYDPDGNIIAENVVKW